MQIARRLLCPSENSAAPFRRKDIPDLLCGSNIRWRGRSFAAAVHSDLSKGQKGRKMVPKDVRRAMVESFVDKYREVNAGKFPTISHAREQVGGSYYVIRQILQELQYKSKLPSVKLGNEHLLVKEVAKDNESLTELEEVSSSQMRISSEDSEYSQLVAVDDMVSDSRGKHYEPKEGSLGEETLSKKVIPPETDSTHSNHIPTQSYPHNVATEASYPYPEEAKNDGRDKTLEDVRDFHGLEPSGEQFQQPTKLEGEPSEKETSNEAEGPAKPSSMWGNLKSLANGFVNMWRKL